MREAVSRMTRWLKKNMWWRLLSLAIATLIWMTVASEPEMATLISVPVQYQQPGDDLEVTSRLVETVQLETRGLSGRLRELANSRTAVVLDFSKVTGPGERTFDITRAQTNLPRGVDLLRASPAQLHFQFEQRETRNVPVVLRFVGALPKGTRLKSFEAIPPTKEIVGPSSKVRRVDRVTTDPVDLAVVRVEHPRAETTAYISEPQVRFVSVPQVTVKMVLK
ncbi:MAG: YbbR family protein [Bryobacterales bacterium]|nr:YbbR family protein [Bryobacterales bacterium]